MEVLKLRYQLREKEIDEILLCLNYKKEGIYRDINVGIASILGLFVLISYIRNPQEFFWAVLLSAVIVLLLYLVYWPVLSRKKRAKRIAQQKGEYRLEIGDMDIRYGEKGETIKLSEGKTEFYSSEHVYVWKIGREVFGIPKRILTGEQSKALENRAIAHRARLVNITIKRSEGYERN